GRFADFHSFRHLYVSRVVRSGATPKVAQTLARHSTVQLTIGRYAHAGLHDLAAAVDSLPKLLPSGPEREALAATGTDGGNDQITLGPNLGPQPAILADFSGQTRTENHQGESEKNPGNTAAFAVFQGEKETRQKIGARGFEPPTSWSRTKRSNP